MVDFCRPGHICVAKITEENFERAEKLHRTVKNWNTAPSSRYFHQVVQVRNNHKATRSYYIRVSHLCVKTSGRQYN